MVRVCDKMDQNTLLTPNEMTDTVGTNQDLFCIHAEVLANKKESRDPSRTAIYIRRFRPGSHAAMAAQSKWTKTHCYPPNEMTDTVGTSRDLFCIHAEVLANKKEGRNPCHS